MKQIEDKLRTAAEHAAPPFSEELRERARYTQRNRRRRNRQTAIRVLAAVAACLVLAVGIMGITTRTEERRVVAMVELDVNPSLRLSLNRSERVIEVVANNADAERVLGGMDLKGVQLDVAVNALIGSLLRNGYINELANSILVSVEGSDSAALQQRLTAEIDALLTGFGIDGAILTQTLSADAKSNTLAEQYGISAGKAALIEQLLAIDPTRNAEELAGLTINALNLLLETPIVESVEISRTGTASEGGYVGADAAKAKALEHAGVAEANAQKLKVEMDVEKGRMVYEIEFDADGYEYDYEIDATTGELVKNQKKVDDDKPKTEPTAPAEEIGIGREKALSIAIEHAGVKASDASFSSVKADRDDGRNVYEIEFFVANVEYDYEIDATTGEVLKSESDKPKEEKQSSASGSSSSNSSSSNSDGERIGTSKAKSIAFNHAGVSSSEARGVEAELDRDDGVYVYEVEFKANGYEYDYKIDALTGEVLGRSRERDD